MNIFIEYVKSTTNLSYCIRTSVLCQDVISWLDGGNIAYPVIKW